MKQTDMKEKGMSPSTRSAIRVVALASDHAGLEARRLLASVTEEAGYSVLDLGTDTSGPVDYPDYAKRVAEAVISDKATCGVLVCGTGIGMSMAANRVPGIRAALCHDVTTARLARLHNDANVLCLGARITGPLVWADILSTFLSTPFEGSERHARRVRLLG